MLDKKALRCEVRARIASIDAVDAKARSASIADEVKRHIAVSGANVVALFSPLGDEPQIGLLIEELSKRMPVVLPCVEGDVMNFYAYDRTKMSKGAFGIDEPRGGLLVAASEIDAIVVPGVAFTKSGVRMGRGKGYYDKYLSQNDFSAMKIGVCYSEQIVDDIPSEPHDVAMDVVIYK